MRDYAELILDLRRHHCDAKEDDTQEVCEECAYDVIVADKSKFNGITDVCTCGLMHRAADAIEELLAAVPHWISVEERLPEKHVEVLICTEDYGKNELGFANTAVWDGSEWIEAWNRKESIPYVSHWMPLPVPPKEDAE